MSKGNLINTEIFSGTRQGNLDKNGLAVPRVVQEHRGRGEILDSAQSSLSIADWRTGDHLLQLPQYTKMKDTVWDRSLY